MKSLKLLLRFLTVGGLVLLLLIPLALIRGMINERESYRDRAVDRVAKSNAGPQRFVGPLRVLPWSETRTYAYAGDDGKLRNRVERKTGYILQVPRSLRIDGKLAPRRLKSGLFEVPIYEWRAKLEADFDAGAPPAEASDGKREYGAPYLVFGIADVRGLVGTPALKLDGKPLELQAGTGEVSGLDGLHAILPAREEGGGGHKLQLDFVLKGTQSLQIAPVGDDNRVALSSPWPQPSFEGYSPRSEVGDKGFDAVWEISGLTTDAPAHLRAGEFDMTSISVKLIDSIDIYTMADRASKYGILFVVLTFVGFGLFELIKRLPIHPLQYLLVGLALAIFFLLLLSLSEYIAFWQAYAVSAVACIGLQFVYLSGVLKSWLRAGGFAAMLTALYGVLYSLLLSEDNALLMGSLLLFGILAAIMWITRKVDWYDLGTSLR
ncbi:MAG: cell envelope integrity protein CreD [Pseudoxanthomonas sp.]